MIDMSKHSRFKQLITSVFAAVLVSVAVVQAPVSAQYSSDSYGACAYGETCAVATTDDTTDNTASDLSNTGENQRLFFYGALILIGAAVVAYTMKRKRHYKLPS